MCLNSKHHFYSVVEKIDYVKLTLPLRKNLLGSKRKAINIYFAFILQSFRLVSSLQQLIL